MALFQSEKELYGAKNVVQFQILGVWNQPFMLRKFHAPVLSDPWRRPCNRNGIFDKISQELRRKQHLRSFFFLRIQKHDSLVDSL